jgi:hypothetical protein
VAGPVACLVAGLAARCAGPAGPGPGGGAPLVLPRDLGAEEELVCSHTSAPPAAAPGAAAAVGGGGRRAVVL